MAVIHGKGEYRSGEGLVGACLLCDSGFTTYEEYEAHDCEKDAAREQGRREACAEIAQRMSKTTAEIYERFARGDYREPITLTEWARAIRSYAEHGSWPESPSGEGGKEERG